MLKRPLSWILMAGCGWLMLVGEELAVAHPFHISTAELEYDAQADRVQVSLKLQAVDLEQELSRTAGQRVTIEHPQAQRQIVEFLSRHFYVSTRSAANASSSRAAGEHRADEINTAVDNLASGGSLIGPRSQVHWVGLELKGAWLWLYFELELPPQRQELQLFNTVLFESNSSQINTVSVRHGARRTTLKMTRQSPSSNFETQWLKRN